MEIRYTVPKHLENFISPMTEDSMNKLLTVLLDIAVRHRMFEYPSLGIERDVANISKEMFSLNQTIKLIASTVDNYHTSLEKKVDNNNAFILDKLNDIMTTVMNMNVNQVIPIENSNTKITLHSSLCNVTDNNFILPNDDIIY